VAISANTAPHATTLYDTTGAWSALPHFNFLPLYIDSYVAEMRAFVQAIQNDTEPVVTGVDGRYPLVMGLAAAKSYRERRPVKLSEITA
jgi:myo-inositol 2-dehydrogenase/D-chiro-inositol 1-dehydrogenase